MNHTRKWTEEKVIAALKPYVDELGFLPTSNLLKDLGRNDLSSQISKYGGWRVWAQKLKTTIKSSGTAKGWSGESKVANWIRSLGYEVEQQACRTHFDLLVQGCLRIDVKTTSLRDYGVARGWFYFIGRITSADVIVCYRSDKDDFYSFPWFRAPSSSLTITQTGKAHSYYHEHAARIIHDMLERRMAEVDRMPVFSYRSKKRATPYAG